MTIKTYAASSGKNRRNWVVTIIGIQAAGNPIAGEGFSRDAAARDAKLKLARHLSVAPHEISLILDGGR